MLLSPAEPELLSASIALPFFPPEDPPPFIISFKALAAPANSNPASFILEAAPVNAPAAIPVAARAAPPPKVPAPPLPTPPTTEPTIDGTLLERINKAIETNRITTKSKSAILSIWPTKSVIIFLDIPIIKIIVIS